MAIDTAAKLRSSCGIGIPGFMPATPDGDITAGDLGTMSGTYRFEGALLSAQPRIIGSGAGSGILSVGRRPGVR